MKKAVISTGGKQYIVSEGDELDIELIKSDKKNTEFNPLLIYDDKKISVGSPVVEAAKVTASIEESEVPQQKVTSIRYKAKKRVRKLKGHRQKFAKIKIKTISSN